VQGPTSALLTEARKSPNSCLPLGLRNRGVRDASAETLIPTRNHDKSPWTPKNALLHYEAVKVTAGAARSLPARS